MQDQTEFGAEDTEGQQGVQLGLINDLRLFLWSNYFSEPTDGSQQA